MPIVIAYFAPRRAGWIFAAVDAPFNFRGFAKDAGFDEGADVHPHAVVEVGMPADGLLRERLPADEDVVGRLAFEDELELVLQLAWRRGAAASLPALAGFDVALAGGESSRRGRSR